MPVAYPHMNGSFIYSGTHLVIQRYFKMSSSIPGCKTGSVMMTQKSLLKEVVAQEGSTEQFLSISLLLLFSLQQTLNSGDWSNKALSHGQILLPLLKNPCPFLGRSLWRYQLATAYGACLRPPLKQHHCLRCLLFCPFCYLDLRFNAKLATLAAHDRELVDVPPPLLWARSGTVVRFWRKIASYLSKNEIIDLATSFMTGRSQLAL